MTAAGHLVVDCQWHWYPPEACATQLGRTAYPLWRADDDGYLFQPSELETWRYGRDYVDLDRQIEIMDDAGIDVAVMSPVIAGDVTPLELGPARELALAFNEQLAAAQRARPDRIVGLAVLPMQDAAAAIEVLDDAVSRLGLAGVLLHSSIAGGSVADPAAWPVYERAQALGVPLFLHPTRTGPPERVTAHELEPPLSYMFDTTSAALAMIVGGVLDAFPELDVVHPHFGGTLPYLVDRVDVYRRLGRWSMERPVREYLARFHTDTVSESPGAFAMARELYGTERILFSSDFPYFPARDGVAFVQREAGPDELGPILSGNAIRLLGLEARLAAGGVL